MHILSFKKIFTAVALAGTVMAAPASQAAALINPLFIPGTNQVEDTDADRILRPDVTGTIVLGGINYRQVTSADTLRNGDVFQAILQFTSLNGPTISANGAPFNDPAYGLLAYSELVVTGLTTAGGIDSYTFTGTGNLQGGANALVDLYENNVLVGDNQSLLSLFSSSPDLGIAEVTDSSLVASFGLGAGEDDFWQARTLSNLAALFAATPGSGQAGLYEFGLSTLLNPGSLPITEEGIVSNAPGQVGTLHDVVGDGSAFARSTGVNTGWSVSTNTTVNFNNVPEPELLVMLSMGLLAAGFLQRRRSA